MADETKESKLEFLAAMYERELMERFVNEAITGLRADPERMTRLLDAAERKVIEQIGRIDGREIMGVFQAVARPIITEAAGRPSVRVEMEREVDRRLPDMLRVAMDEEQRSITTSYGGKDHPLRGLVSEVMRVALNKMLAAFTAK